MGPLECIGRAFQKNNGPKRSNRQQHLPMQWAHLNASAVPHRNLMGPSEVIGSSIANAMGPSECIGSASQKLICPMETIYNSHHLWNGAILGICQCPPQN